jgi:hypothetical protein
MSMLHALSQKLPQIANTSRLICKFSPNGRVALAASSIFLEIRGGFVRQFAEEHSCIHTLQINVKKQVNKSVISTELCRISRSILSDCPAKWIVPYLLEMFTFTIFTTYYLLARRFLTFCPLQ